MNAFDKALEDNGSSIIDGFEYARYNRVRLRLKNGTPVYKCIGFLKGWMEKDGAYDPSKQKSVVLMWDANEVLEHLKNMGHTDLKEYPIIL